MRTHSRFGLGLAMVTALMLVTACSDGGGSPVDPPPPPPPAQTKEIGVWTENKQPVPDGTTVTIIDRNGSRSALVVGDRAKFVLDPDLVADGDSVSIYVSGSDLYYPSYGKVQITVMRYYDVGAILVPAKRCLVKDNVGDYTGEYKNTCMGVSLPEAFGPRPTEYGQGFYMVGRIGGIKLPIKVALSPSAEKDSAVIWSALHEFEQSKYGYPNMYVAASYGEIVDSTYENGHVSAVLHGLYVGPGPYDNGASVVDGKTGLILGGVLMYKDVSMFENSNYSQQFLLKTLGPVTTCDWLSVVSCPGNPPKERIDGATVGDIFYTRLMHSTGNSQYEHRAQLGLYAGLQGYNYAKEHNLPRPLLN